MTAVHRLCIGATLLCLSVGCRSPQEGQYSEVVEALSDELFVPKKRHELEFLGYEVPSDSQNADWPPSGFYVSIDFDTYLLRVNEGSKQGFVVTRFIPQLVEVEDVLHEGKTRTVDSSILLLRHKRQIIPVAHGQTVNYWEGPGDSLLFISGVIRHGTDVTGKKRQRWRAGESLSRGARRSP